MLKTYSSRPNAVRGLGRHLGHANTEDLNLVSLIKQTGSEFSFDTDEADALAGLKGMSEEDENLKLFCGHVNCPSCGIHLSNGVTDFDGVVDAQGSEAAAFKVMKHEFSCLGCNAEWGNAIVLKGKTASDKPTKTGRTYPNRATSDVLKPSELVFGLADAMKDAKRKDVVDAAIAKGVTPNTARAAYQHWRQARGLVKGA